MSMFNILFATALLIALANVASIVLYVRLINYGLNLASLPPIREALKSNKHYSASVLTSMREHQRYSGFWFGISQIAVFLIVMTWGFGYFNDETLTDLDVFFVTIATAVAIGRSLVAPIVSGWLAPWIIGLRAVLVACHKQAIEDRIEEIMACDDSASDPMAYIELQMLAAELERINAAIGTAPGSPQSGGAEQ